MEVFGLPVGILVVCASRHTRLFQGSGFRGLDSRVWVWVKVWGVTVA